MSANLDLVRSIFADWERGDFSRADWADPEIELVVADGPLPGHPKGHAGMAQAWRDVLSAWEDVRMYVDECRELDEERVLVLIRYTGRGRTSGMDIGQMGSEGVQLLTIRDGKVTRLVGYNNRRQGLADLGLVAEDLHDWA